MTLAKIYLSGQERELLWVDTNYRREIGKSGKPTTEVMGGFITFCFISQADDDILLRSIIKKSNDESGEEKDKMLKGEVCFFLTKVLIIHRPKYGNSMMLI